MRGSRTGTLILSALLAFTGLAAINSPKTAAQDSDSTLTNEGYLHDRSILGFQDDVAYLSEMDSTYPVDPYFGFPMTPSEHTELVRRAMLAPDIAAVEKLLGNRADYSGIWMDQLEGGVVTVAFTGPSSESDDAAVKAILPPETPYRFITLKNSKIDLDLLQARITKDIIDGTEPDGVPFNSSAVSVKSNLVTISVPPSTTEAEVGDIASYYGPSYTEVTRAQPYQSSSVGNWDYTTGRLFGGQWVNAYPAGGTGERCSVTYADAKSATNQTYAMTAGHCGHIGHYWYQGYAATPGSASLVLQS